MPDSFSQNQVSRIALKVFQAQHPGVNSSGEFDAGPSVRVDRLDRPAAYLLVPIHDVVGLRGIVQLNMKDLSVESSAVIRDPGTVFLATEAEVLAAVQSALPDRVGWRKPFLAWRPCRESFDSLRPLWVVPHRDGQVYVTQSCDVFEVLTAGRGG
jgi:hypothetical protein